MIHKLDFKNFTLKDTLDIAILMEEESRDRYLEIADQLGSSHPGDASEFFIQMSQNEEMHRKELSEERKKLFGNEVSELSESIKDDMRYTEALPYDEVRLFMPKRQALELALACEIRAFNIFQKAASQVLDPKVKSIFLNLRDEEKKHQVYITNLISKTTSDLRPEVPNEDVDTPSL